MSIIYITPVVKVIHLCQRRPLWGGTVRCGAAGEWRRPPAWRTQEFRPPEEWTVWSTAPPQSHWTLGVSADNTTDELSIQNMTTITEYTIHHSQLTK